MREPQLFTPYLFHRIVPVSSAEDMPQDIGDVALVPVADINQILHFKWVMHLCGLVPGNPC